MFSKRKRLLVVVISLTFSVNALSQSKVDEFLFYKTSDIGKIKEAVASNNPSINSEVEILKQLQKKYLKLEPLSVTNTPSPVKSGNPHDYFSESPYWWPDPKDPNAPYIRKDGERNPERFDKHRRDLELMSQAVLYLSMSAYFLDSKEAAEKSKLFIQTWFLNEKTKMNPHMQYAQAIRNKSDGRGTGIIDSRSFVYVLEGVNFLRKAGFWGNELDAQLKSWLKEYLFWLTTSKNGLDEKNSKNNHSTWWAVQVAAISSFLDDKKVFEMVIDHTKNNLFENQIEKDGSQPLEEVRTNSLSYSVFNLDAYSMLLRIAELKGTDIWNYTNSKGAGIKNVLDYLSPYLKNPTSWKKQQISPYENNVKRFLPIMSKVYGEAEYMELYMEDSEKLESENRNEAFLLLLTMHSKLNN